MSEFLTPQSRNEAIIQNICGANNVLPEPQSRVEKLLQAILYEDETIVDFEPESRAELLLYAILTHGEYDAEPQSRNETILKAILTGGDYDALPQSRIEALLIEWLDQTHYEEKTVSGSVVSIADAVDAPVADLIAAIVPVQSGSGDPSPTNIRPISGWTECKVTRAGANLFDADEWIKLGVNSTKYAVGDDCTVTVKENDLSGISNRLITLAPNIVYSFYKDNRFSDIRVYNSSGTNISIANRFTVPTDGKVAIKFYASTYPTTGQFAFVVGAAPPSDLTPYIGDTYTVTFGSAGTVYGGTRDVTTGKLTATMANIASYNGETLPGTWISDRDVYAEGTTPTIGAQVVYDLATPIVYHLTPVEIRTLAGQNTIWADTGSVTVTYKAQRTAAALMMVAGRF